MFAELNVLMTRVVEHAHSFYRCVGNFMNLEETLYLRNANVEKGSLRGFTKLRIIKPQNLWNSGSCGTIKFLLKKKKAAQANCAI